MLDFQVDDGALKEEPELDFCFCISWLLFKRCYSGHRPKKIPEMQNYYKKKEKEKSTVNFFTHFFLKLLYLPQLVCRNVQHPAGPSCGKSDICWQFQKAGWKEKKIFVLLQKEVHKKITVFYNNTSSSKSSQV